MTQQLSPIAQAVQFAAFRVYDEEEHLYVVSAEKHAGMIAAAAIRAAADQEEIFFDAYDSPVRVVTVDDLLAIADELEA